MRNTALSAAHMVIYPEGLGGDDMVNKEHIEGWMKWLSNSRNCCPDTCNVRLGSLRVFLQFLSNKDIAYLY